MTPGVDLSNIPENVIFFFFDRFPPKKKKITSVSFVKKKDGRLCPTRRRNARGSLLIVYYLEQLPGRPRPPFFLLPEFCLLPPNCFFLFCVCALGYFYLFLVFLVFFPGECCCPATNSYRYDDLIQSVVGGTHTIFSSVFR